MPGKQRLDVAGELDDRRVVTDVRSPARSESVRQTIDATSTASRRFADKRPFMAGKSLGTVGYRRAGSARKARSIVM